MQNPTHAPLISVIALGVLCVSTQAVAQEQKAVVELTPAQIELNNKATIALNEKRPDVALDYMRAAIRERGDVEGQRGDLLFLTLGRAFQLKRQCDLAKESFATAEREAAVAGVPPDFVSKKLAEYRAELPTLCQAKLTISCVDANALISIDGAQAQEKLCGTTQRLEPGEHSVVATVSKAKVKRQDFTLSLVGDQEAEIQVTLKQSIIKTKESIPTSAIIVAASTLALSGGLWGYTAYARSSGENAYNDYRQARNETTAAEKEALVRDWESKAKLANRAAIGVAVVGAAATIALIFWPRQEEAGSQEEPSPAARVGSTWSPSLNIGSDSWGLSAQVHW